MHWIRVFSEISLPAAIQELKCEKSKFEVFPEGSYVDYYPNKVSRSEARKFLNVADDKMILLYTGFIKPYKGIDRLIECFKKSFTESSILIIAGKVRNSDYFETIKKSISNNIILIDRFIENEELQYFFNAADVVTLPFKKIENSGSVILAMGFKKPVIAPSMGVLKHRLHNQRELLFTDSLEQSFEILRKESFESLQKIGAKNYAELSKYKWSDFANAF